MPKRLMKSMTTIKMTRKPRLLRTARALSSNLMKDQEGIDVLPTVIAMEQGHAVAPDGARECQELPSPQPPYLHPQLA